MEKEYKMSQARKDELEQVVRDGETLHVDCQFCDQVYDFTPQDVAALLRTLEEAPEADA